MICSRNFEGIAKLIATLTADLEEQRNMMYAAIKWKTKFGVYAVPKPRYMDIIFPICEN